MTRASAADVPVVDLHDLHHHDPQRQAAAAEAIAAGFRGAGLVYVRGHGIEREALLAFYRSFLAFTARPEAEKAPLSRPDIWFQRGWTPPNTEHAVVAGGQPDFKECYFAAPEPLDPVSSELYPEIYAANVWPEGAPEFKEAYLALGHRLHEVGLEVLRACAMALGLRPTTLVDMVYGGPHVTRALRYLPLDAAQVEDRVLWGEEHTDFNLITLLPGGQFWDEAGEAMARPADGSGLFIRTRATGDAPGGSLLPGTPPPGCVVVQVGQQLEILTAGAFLATPHVITAPQRPGISRTSMAHFVHLNTRQILFPLKPFRTPERIRAYSPPVLAGTYNTKTLVDIGLAPRAALDAFGYRHYDRLEGQRGALSPHRGGDDG